MSSTFEMRFAGAQRCCAMVVMLGVAAASAAQTLQTVNSHALMAAVAGSNVTANGAGGVSASVVDAGLPDAPSTEMVRMQGSAAAGQIAPRYESVIAEGYVARPITAHDKVIIGLKDSVSLTNFAGMLVSAGYSHVTNGQPNYGVNGKAFGQRLGAAAVRETSETLFTESVFAPLLHQDPRYYVRGGQHGVLNRTAYAITRPLITRTDSGRSTVNASLLLGYAGSTALNNAFYPQINRNFTDNAKSYGGSIGGAALGFFVAEFTDDVLQALHLEKKK